jgi:hypothetical protein
MQTMNIMMNGPNHNRASSLRALTILACQVHAHSNRSCLPGSCSFEGCTFPSTVCTPSATRARSAPQSTLIFLPELLVLLIFGWLPHRCCSFSDLELLSRVGVVISEELGPLSQTSLVS